MDCGSVLSRGPRSGGDNSVLDVFTASGGFVQEDSDVACHGKGTCVVGVKGSLPE